MERADDDQPPCDQFQHSIQNYTISSYLNCTVLAVECIQFCPLEFITNNLIPGIKKLLNTPNGSIVESMLTNLPDFCDIFSERFPQDSEIILVQELIPEIGHVIEKVGELFIELSAETLASLFILCSKETFLQVAVPLLKKLLAVRKKEVRMIALQILIFISEYFPCDFWFDQLNDFISILGTDSIGSVRANLPPLLSVYSKKIADPEKQSMLVGRFQLFCKDKSVLVRKSCAESLVALSDAVDENVRLITILPSANILLSDQSESVRSIILRNLGPLIASIGNQCDISLLTRYTNALASTDPTIEFASAFSFPAVTLSLGKERWNELKDSFEIAILSREFRVRKTLAFGLSSFAFVMNENELSNALLGFLRDLPEIADGIIQNLHQFLPLISERRDKFLQFLQNPLDKYGEWRIRLHVSQQCRFSLEFFGKENLYPIAKDLVMDKVAVVRKDAVQSFALLLNDSEICYKDIIDLSNEIYHFYRIAVCNILAEAPIDLIKKWVDILKRLCIDKVPNVRVAAISAIVFIMKRIESNSEFDFTELIENARSDSDIDVQESLKILSV